MGSIHNDSRYGSQKFHEVVKTHACVPSDNLYLSDRNIYMIKHHICPLEHSGRHQKPHFNH